MNLVTLSVPLAAGAFTPSSDFHGSFGAASDPTTLRVVAATSREEVGGPVVEATNAECSTELSYSAEVIEAIHHLAALKTVAPPEGENEFLAWLHGDQK